MQRTTINAAFISVILTLICVGALWGQNSTSGTWDLNRCISYALENNIQVNQHKMSVLSSQVDLMKSKSQRLPSLSASVSESISNAKDITGDAAWEATRSTGVALSASMSVYEGGAISNTIKKNALALDQANLQVEEMKNSITLSIVQAYLNVLYANESAEYYKSVVETSQKQVDRITSLFNAGSAVRTDLVKMQAQLASDSYSLTVAQNTLISTTTTLKQLLEIPVLDTFSVAFPEVQVDNIWLSMPSKVEALNVALETRLEIKSSRIDSSLAVLDLKIAKAGYLPSLSLSASYQSSYSSGTTGGFGSQLSDNQAQRVGLTLSIPIFSRNANKAAVQQSKIGIEQAKLSYMQVEKTLLQDVENVYQDALASICRYKSAVTQLESASESYKLSQNQFNLGMINTVELLDVKTTELNAQKELIQSKYSAVLNMKVLDFYMGKQITL